MSSDVILGEQLKQEATPLIWRRPEEKNAYRDRDKNNEWLLSFGWRPMQNIRALETHNVARDRFRV